MGTSRIGFVLSGMCALVLALGPSVARAQEEEPPAYPPQYQYPPPQYPYQPLTRDQARMMKPPPKGTAAIITGFVLLPIGLILAGASIPVWTESCQPNGCNPQVAAVGMILDLLGGGFLIASLVLIPIGFVRRARYHDWMRAHGYAVSAAPGGLQLRF